MVGGRRSAESSRSRDRGAALVEAALVTPMVMILLFGIFEAGWLMKTHLSIEQTTSYGARVGAVAGADPDADVLILDEIEKRLVHGRSSIARVIVYRAASVEASPPVNCLTVASPGSVADACTVYTPADFDRSAASLSCAWCPSDREGDELLGLWISYDYQSLTGLFGSTDLTNNTVLPIEYPAGVS